MMGFYIFLVWSVLVLIGSYKVARKSIDDGHISMYYKDEVIIGTVIISYFLFVIVPTAIVIAIEITYFFP